MRVTKMLHIFIPDVLKLIFFCNTEIRYKKEERFKHFIEMNCVIEDNLLVIMININVFVGYFI